MPDFAPVAALCRVCLSAAVLASALLLPQWAVAAQWKWRDAQGVTHYSDQPPPASIPARDILQRPAQTAAAAAPGAPAASHPAGPTELEKKIAEKNKAEQAAQEQAKRQQQQAQALVDQQNCLQAQQQLRVIDSGQRLTQIDAQGQRVFLDDAQRAAERARVSALIAQYCH
ncbi:DUF4124 domain-containing protein [Thiomonas sp.]|jgi:hypothetical protein|uniref:DUF4124 domain-containing protein n=1 Tax=Thiomonas sp. TaxID=2047785 RepID=UPI002613E21D|nr:DUF4124 domain-containing protein [Thiomonas sp.]